MNPEPFVIERTFDATTNKIWKAITDKDEMKKWYFDLAEFKPEVGFVFKFSGGRDERVYHHECEITELIPLKKLRHSWHYVGYEGMSFVTWQLFDEGDTTRVKLTHEGLESFPQNNNDFARESFAEGWTNIIGQSLKEFAEKK